MEDLPDVPEASETASGPPSNAGLLVAALAAAEDDVEHALDIGDPARLAVARIEAALLAGELSGPEVAIARLHEVEVPPGAEAVSASLSFRLGALYGHIGKQAAALASLDDAYRRFADLGDELAVAQAQAERAVARAAVDDWHGAVEDATAAFLRVTDGSDGVNGDDVARRRGQICLTVARVLQDAGLFSSAEHERPGALEVLVQATTWLDGTGDEPHAAAALAHFRHTDGTFRIPEATAPRLHLAVEDPADPVAVGLAGAQELARRGSAHRAATVFRDVGRVLWRAPDRALTALRAAATLHRNLGEDAELACDLAEAAAALAASGDLGAAAASVELAVRAARRHPGGAGGVHALLLEAADVLAGGDGAEVWLVRASVGAVTDLWGRPPGPAGEVAVHLAPGVVAFCDIADLSLTRVHQTIPSTTGLVAVLLADTASSDLVEAQVPASAPVLTALSVLGAVAAAHDHATDEDPLAEVLLRLQWASGLTHPALRDVVDAEMVEGAWATARATIRQLDQANRERLYHLFGAERPELASAIEVATIDPTARDLLAALDRFEEETAAPSAAVVSATTRGSGVTGAGRGAHSGAGVGGARRLSALAAVSARRSSGSAELWSEAARAWAPHDRTREVLCEWHAGQLPVRPGLAYIELEVRRRQPSRAVRTWDSHAGRP